MADEPLQPFFTPAVNKDGKYVIRPTSDPDAFSDLNAAKDWLLAHVRPENIEEGTWDDLQASRVTH